MGKQIWLKSEVTGSINVQNSNIFTERFMGLNDDTLCCIAKIYIIQVIEVIGNIMEILTLLATLRNLLICNELLMRQST